MASDREVVRESRRTRAADFFAEPDVRSVLDLLEVFDRAWHDYCAESRPPQLVVDDLFVLNQGDLSKLIGATRSALRDWRDTRLAADAI